MNEHRAILLKKPCSILKGVGEAKAALFQRLGIFTVGDVITHYPRDYEDRSRLKKLAGACRTVNNAPLRVIIASKVVESRPRKGLLVSRVSIRDDTGLINATMV